MVQRKRFLPVLLLLLLIPVGIVAAESSSSSYVLQRSVMVGGGSADSAGFSVTSVIGQPATDVTNSSSFKVSGGFLFPVSQAAPAPSDERTWLPIVLK